MNLKVAYLAPEFPSLSTTFIYNEALQLEATGVDVCPYSVHIPFSNVEDAHVQSIKKRTAYLYSKSILKVLSAHLSLLFSEPKRYFYTLSLLVSDMFEVGFFSRVGIGLFYRFFYAAWLANDMKNNGCEHLHIHFAHVPADIGMYASNLAGISFSITAHANDLFDKAWLLRTKVTRSSFFATISNYNKQFLISKGADKNKVKVIRCGVSEVLFNGNHIEKKSNMIGVVCRLVEKKGIDTLISATKILVDRGVSINVKIHGSGPLENDLREMVHALRLQNNIEFLGAISHEEVATFIQSLKAFVLPCKVDKNGDVDGIPVVLMESMAIGVPVISTEVSGIPELIENGVSGLICPPDDPIALSHSILQILEMNHDEVMLSQAKRKIKNEYSLTKNSNQLIHLIKNAVNMA